MVLIAIIAVAAGVIRLAPGLGIVLLISALPAWAIAEVRARRRRHRNQPMSGPEKALWIIGLTILIPVLLIVALVIALFLLCAFFAR